MHFAEIASDIASDTEELLRLSVIGNVDKYSDLKEGSYIILSHFRQRFSDPATAHYRPVLNSIHYYISAAPLQKPSYGK